MLFDVIKAIFQGIVEGLTEFLPVSSTGHLLLVDHFFGPEPEKQAFWDSFNVLIQFGAILALLTIYFTRLWKIALGMFTNADDRRFVLGLLIAFLPAAVIGATAYRIIKGVLFNPWIVCVSLIVGGVILILLEKVPLKTRYHDATKFPLPTYLLIGLFQCLAMIPGVSRSGATIVSARVLGADRRSSAEFSFFLAMPTMAGAFAYELYKSWHEISAASPTIVAIGFVVSFISAWIVVKSFLDYVSSHGFAAFGWWRIVVGAAALVALALVG
ncbi:MAG TPA: undecaprenyl-diphosphate phosphatase [Xanthobacteraceae bacterium]|nr:undecaprenyl-diphosphate phosphatase [Xanthobacteraceae bacterium]